MAAKFGPGRWNPDEFQQKIVSNDGLESKLYAISIDVLSDPENIKEIEKEFPKRSIAGRNTGYAIDMLAGCNPSIQGESHFNFAALSRDLKEPLHLFL